MPLHVDHNTSVDLLIKVGGGLLASPRALTDVLALISVAAQYHRLVVLPGGGPFADAVRTVDKHIGLGDDEAHWLATMATSQLAVVLAARLEKGEVVFEPDDLATSLNRGNIPVLAPYRWLRRADPLPHSWEVTSDSFAAWIAGELQVKALMLAKPPQASDPLVDAYFTRALPRGLRPVIAKGVGELHTALEAFALEQR